MPHDGGSGHRGPPEEEPLLTAKPLPLLGITTLAATALVLSTALVLPTATATPLSTPATAPIAMPAPGWSAVVLARAESKPGRLVLVSPTGAQRVVTALAAGDAVVDISNDGRRVIVNRGASVKTWEKAGHHQTVDTRTGRITRIAGHWSSLRFTNPSGTSLLAREIGDTGPNDDPGKLRRLVRLDMTGRIKAVMAGTVNGFGGKHDPSGRFVVSANTKGLMQVNDNATGKVVRLLPASPRAGMCEVRHWESATQFSMTCMKSEPGRGWHFAAYRQSITGSRAVEQGSNLSRAGQALPNVYDVWNTPAGSFAFAQGAATGSRSFLVSTAGTKATAVAWADATPVVMGSKAYLLQKPRATGGHAAAAGPGVGQDPASGRRRPQPGSGGHQRHSAEPDVLTCPSGTAAQPANG